MNSNFRSLFLVMILSVSAILTGCGTTGNPLVDRTITLGSLGAVAGNLATGNSEGARKGAALGIVAGILGVGSQQTQQPQPGYQQQPQVGYQPQQQGHPGCQNGARPYFLQDGRPACMNQMQQQPQPPQPPQQQYYQSQRQCQMRDICDWRANVCRKVCD